MDFKRKEKAVNGAVIDSIGRLSRKSKRTKPCNKDEDYMLETNGGGNKLNFNCLAFCFFMIVNFGVIKWKSERQNVRHGFLGCHP